MSNAFETQEPLRPGDVVLAFAGPTPAKYLLGTWLQSVAQDARSAAADTPIYVIGLDEATMGENSVARFLEELTAAVGGRFPAPKLISLGTEEAEACLAICPFGDPDAIVAILDTERLRFVDLEPGGPKIESVEGSVIRISEKDDLSLRHVARLCAQICERAPASRQKWLIVSRGFGFGNNIPPNLAALPNLDINELQDEGHDSTLTEEFRAILATVQADGPKNALDWIAKRLPSGKIATIARANVLSLCGQPIQAYRAIAETSSEILSDQLPEEIIQLAQMAVSAGSPEDGHKWIRYLPPPRTLGLENLRALRLLAKNLRATQLWQDCVGEFRRRFPNDPLTCLDRYNELLDAKEYEAAVKQADETGHPYRRELARFLADPSAALETFLKAAEIADEMSEAHWIIAKCARDREEFALARDHLRSLSGDERRGGAAAAMRAEILRAQIPGIDEAILQEEIRSLLAWCANHPAELDARFALEELYDSVSTEREALVHTMALLTQELQRLAKAFVPSAIPVRAALDQPLKGEPNDNLLQLMKELFGPAQRSGVAIGAARLTPAQAKLITPQLWSEMGVCLARFIDEANEQGAIQLLHIIMAVARETHDPASDLLAARQVLSLLANSNQPQQALDLAETLLTLLPANHNDLQGWRLSMAWLSYADVSIRLGNVLGGLRYLCFSCLCLQETPRHARLFLEIFRTAARAAREAHFPPLALQFLGLESSLLTAFPTLNERARELQQMMLSIMLRLWTPGDGPAPLLAVAKEALDLLEQCKPDDEVAPLLSVAAQAAQFYVERGGGSLPADMKSQLETFLTRVPEPFQTSLRAVIGHKVDVGLLRELATRTVRASADWSASLSPALVAARRALPQACESGDASLFWTACLILCQPGLSVRVSERNEQSPHADPVGASKWLAKQIKAGTDHPLEAMQVQRAMSHASADAVGEKLFEISLEEFLRVIDPHETVVLVAADNANRLYRLELRHGSAGTPTKVDATEWDHKRFNLWSRAYPAKYGTDLEVWFGNVCKPPATEVPPTLAGLLPSGRLTTPVATLVAESRLLTFTHRLASDLAGSPTSLSVSPSARWLGITRRRNEPKPQRALAWMGSPQSADKVVKALQTEVIPLMQSLDIEVSTAETLPQYRDAHLVILGSHGRAENAYGFAKLSDSEQNYEPDRVASALAGTTCVVLFVCHAGRGDEAMFSHETTGLTSSLLRHGVRTVIAALWPVDVAIVKAWLEEFAKTDLSHSVVERVDQAQRTMAKRPAFAEQTGENSLVRCTFTVFGDGCLRVEFPARKAVSVVEPR